MSAARVPAVCPMGPLVEAAHDRRLGDRDFASLQRHLEGCSVCRAQRADLQELRALAPRAAEIAELTPLEHRRRRLAVLRAAAAPRPAPPRAADARWVWLPAVALVAVALAWVAAVRDRSEALPMSAPLGSVSVATLATADAVAAAVPVRAEVVASPGASWEQTTGFDAGIRVDRVSLREGTVEVAIDRLAHGQRFVVATSDAEVEVRGTRFSVVAVASRLREIRVAEGRVELRFGAESKMLEAGDVWTAPASVPPPSVAARPKAPSSGFADGIALLEAGDFGGARAAFERYAAEHPDDAMVEDADFLVVIALQRAGRLDEAKAAARRYVERYPNGSRRAEALRIAEGDP